MTARDKTKMESESRRSTPPTIVNVDTFKPLDSPQIRQKSVPELLLTAKLAFRGGRTKSLEFRRKQLNNLLLLLDENNELFEDALRKDLRRHKHEAQIFDLMYTRNVVVKAIKHLNEWTKCEYPPKPLINMFDKIKIKKEPYGVVLIMSAWNFPVNLLLAPFVGALAAGNCCILKPSEIAEATAELLLSLFPKYMDPECYQVFNGGIVETTELLAQRFDYIFYTGSTFVGRIIHAAANKYITPCTLELGGKSPVYIDRSVDIEKVTKRVLWGKITNCGQICISPDYVLCDSDIQGKFVETARRVLKEWFGEDPQVSPSYSRLISDKHYKRLTQFLEDKTNIAIGGRRDASDRYLEPTVLTNVSPNDPIMQEEIFGPILPIVVVASEVEAINFINAGEKPLIMYVFSNQSDTKDMFVQNTSSGSISINDTIVSFQADCLPFGGVGYSGMGAYHGKYSVDVFSHKKSVYETGYLGIVDAVLSYRYPPYSEKTTKVLTNVLHPWPTISPSLMNTIFVFCCGVVFVLIVQYINAFVKGRN